jgi:hypothetical protein
MTKLGCAGTSFRTNFGLSAAAWNANRSGSWQILGGLTRVGVGFQEFFELLVSTEQAL